MGATQTMYAAIYRETVRKLGGAYGYEGKVYQLEHQAKIGGDGDETGAFEMIPSSKGLGTIRGLRFRPFMSFWEDGWGLEDEENRETIVGDSLEDVIFGWLRGLGYGTKRSFRGLRILILFKRPPRELGAR